MMDTVKVQLYDPFSQGGQAYLGSADIVVGFASAKKRTEKAYDQDELAQAVIKVSPTRTECLETLLTLVAF